MRRGVLWTAMGRVLHILSLIFLLTIGLFGCGKSKETCQRESADLATMFASMDTKRGIETRFVKLVQRDELPIAADEFGVVLEVSAEGIRSAGITETPSEPQVVIDLLLQKWRGSKLPRLILAIDSGVHWLQLTSLFTGLEATGFSEVALVFARKAVTSTPPPRTAFDLKLDEAEKAMPSERATQVAQLASELVKDCEAINTLFASVGGEEDKTNTMIKGLPPALVECRCKCDVPALKSLMYRLLANRAPTTTIHVKLRGEKLALRGELAWSETSLQLREGQAFKAETRMLNP